MWLLFYRVSGARKSDLINFMKRALFYLDKLWEVTHKQEEVDIEYQSSLHASPKNLQALYLSIINHPAHSQLIVSEEVTKIISILER